MNTKARNILSYIGLVGLLIAALSGKREDIKFHLNQGFVLYCFTLIGVCVPFVGWAWLIFMTVCQIMGIVHAAKGEEIELPLIGKLRWLSPNMPKKARAILAHCLTTGFLVSSVYGEKEDVLFDLNQGLVVIIFSTLSCIPYIGWLWECFIMVCVVMGIVNAAKGVEKELPLIGKIHILDYYRNMYKKQEEKQGL